MPWTIKDVPRFTKKAKTTAQKKKWVSIANSVLRDCQAKKGKDCEAKAIKVANSKFSERGMTMENKVPKGALRFVAEGCHAHVEFATDGTEKKIPILKMVAYSGGVIKGHWYWDNLAIDLDGIKFKQSKFPVLENHDTNRKIAVIGKPVIEDGKLMAPENAKFLSTEYSEEFQRLSSEGFPYQSSIYAKPSSVERLEEGATAKVNGFTLKGPASIWRECEFKEMSVCVFGWDSNTKASAFSKEETEDVDFLESTIPAEEAGIDNNDQTGEEVNTKMNREELQEKYSELIQEIVNEAVAKAETKFSADKKALEEKLAKEKEENIALSDRVQKLEKNELVRQEKEFKVTASGIWTEKLADSRVPSHLHAKVSRFVEYSKYVNDGSFDVAAFTEAVDAEIKDWEDRGVVDTVIGNGFSEKEVDQATREEETRMAENKTVAQRLIEKSGIKIPKE